MQAGEPMANIRVVSPLAISAAPKSVTLISVSPAKRMFAGFMSRWVMPTLCANSSARVHLKTISTTFCTGSRPSGWQNPSSVPPSTYSITM